MSTAREVTSCEVTRHFPSILWNLKFHYHIHKNSPRVPSRARPIQSTTSHPLSTRSSLILSTYLRFGPLSGRFTSGVPTNYPYTIFFSPFVLHAHLILLYIYNHNWRRYKSLCRFHSPIVISSLFGPNILLSTMFSHTLSLRSSLTVSNHVSHP
jgi:hypothetical protein